MADFKRNKQSGPSVVFQAFFDSKAQEIAEILGISEGTSKSNLAKAKANLQKILEKEFEKITTSLFFSII